MKFEIVSGGMQNTTPQQPSLPFEIVSGGTQSKAPSNILRNVARTGARAIEEAVGLPRSLAEFGASLANLAWSGAEPVTKSGKKYSALAQPISILPSAQTVRDYVTQPLAELVTGSTKYLKPQTATEESIDEIVQTAVPFFFGSFKSLPANIAKGLGIASAGQLGKWGAKELGAGELGQELAKVGTMIGTSLIGIPTARKFAGTLYDQAERGIPESLLVTAKPIEREIKKARTFLKRGFGKSGVRNIGLTADSKEFVENAIQKIKTKIKPAGTIELKELPNLKKDYNELFKAGRVPDRAKPIMRDIFSSFKESYKDAPKSVDQALQALNLADDIYRSSNVTQNIKDFVKNNKTLRRIAGYGTAGAVIKSGPGAIIRALSDPKAIISGGALGLGYGALKTADIIGHIIKSPGMRHYYSQVISSLLQEKALGALKAAEKLANLIKKEAIPSPER